jgi:hypothetical protein
VSSAVAILLLIIPVVGFAMDEITIISKERVKKLALPQNLWVYERKRKPP